MLRLVLAMTPIIRGARVPPAAPPDPVQALTIVGGIACGIILLLILAALLCWRKDQVTA
jgi:hypothetical protein